MLIEQRNGFNSLKIIPNSEVLIGRVDGICIQSEAHKNGLALQLLFKKGNNGNTATAVLRKYCPGLLTGVLVLAPTALSLLVYGFRNGYVHSPTVWLIAIPFAAAIAGSIPLLFKAGRALRRMVR